MHARCNIHLQMSWNMQLSSCNMQDKLLSRLVVARALYRQIPTKHRNNSPPGRRRDSYVKT